MSNALVTAVYETRFGNSSAKAVLARLADRTNDDGYCFPSNESIARDTEFSLRQVQRILQIFQNLGIVQRHELKTERFDYYLVINPALVGKGVDHSERFAAEHARLQGKVEAETAIETAGNLVDEKGVSLVEVDISRLGDGGNLWDDAFRCLPGRRAESSGDARRAHPASVSETSLDVASVSETPTDVSETRVGVSETHPPHPLLGRTVREPTLEPASASRMASPVTVMPSVVARPVNPPEPDLEELACAIVCAHPRALMRHLEPGEVSWADKAAAKDAMEAEAARAKVSEAAAGRMVLELVGAIAKFVPRDEWRFLKPVGEFLRQRDYRMPPEAFRRAPERSGGPPSGAAQPKPLSIAEKLARQQQGAA